MKAEEIDKVVEERIKTIFAKAPLSEFNWIVSILFFDVCLIFLCDNLNIRSI